MDFSYSCLDLEMGYTSPKLTFQVFLRTNMVKIVNKNLAGPLVVFFLFVSSVAAQNSSWQILSPPDNHVFTSTVPLTTIPVLATKAAGTPGTMVIIYPDFIEVPPGPNDPPGTAIMTQATKIIEFANATTNCLTSVDVLPGKEKLTEGTYLIGYFEATKTELEAMTAAQKAAVLRAESKFSVTYIGGGGGGGGENETGGN